MPASAPIKVIDQKSASITHRAVKFARVTINVRISALLTFNLSFKFRFTVAFFMMFGFRLRQRASTCDDIYARVYCILYYVYGVVVKKFTFTISSVDEFIVEYELYY